MTQAARTSLEQYAAVYEDIARAFLADVQQSGLPLAAASGPAERPAAPGLVWGNEGKSGVYRWRSPACDTCRRGDGSISFYLSLQCRRHCYYCFNPNQEHYEWFSQHVQDAAAELRRCWESGRELTHIALTGGEPLLHARECAAFFAAARTLYPAAHLRLYTAGDLLTEALARQLAAAGLDEVRIGVKLADAAAERERVWAGLTAARRHLARVVAEMPVIPGTLEEMKALLLHLQRLGADGINLLEFCYPFVNAEAFLQRGFCIKNPPFLVPYDYEYAGGLPVDGSERECFALLRYAAAEKLSLGVHYCSLENKHTAQIFAQNRRVDAAERYYFSPRDFFLKSVKSFGRDLAAARDLLAAAGAACRIDASQGYAEFHPRHLPRLLLAGLRLEFTVALHVAEQRGEELCLREVALRPLPAGAFDWEKL